MKALRTAWALGLVTASLLGPRRAAAQAKSFPAGFTEDVKAFGARGDGITDDTAAIQAALVGDRSPQAQPDFYSPRPRVVHFPPGTYLVSGTLTWLGCALQIQGSGSASVIKLRDAAPGFGDKTQRKPVIATQGGTYSFKENIWDLTVDTGKSNPGAVGIDWISNNVGSLRNVTVRSGDGQGVAAVDMTRSWPGPALVRDLQTEGFDYGVDIGQPEYGPTFEGLSIRNPRVAALHNNGNILAIRRLLTDGAPLAVDNEGGGGMVLLLDSELRNGPAGKPAIANRGLVYLRNVTSTGYANVVTEKGQAVQGTVVAGEYLTGKPQQLFPSPQRSLRLPIEEVPSFHDPDLSRWEKIDCGYQGCESRIQPALDSGKATVWFPSGVHLIGGQSFRVPKTVRRILGFGSNVNDYDALGLTFVVDEDAPEPVLFEQFANRLKIVHASKRSVVVKSSDLDYTPQPGAGKLLLDDVGMSHLALAKGQQVWARQLNIEGPDLHIDNEGASLWIFGLKSEGKGTIARTHGGGYTELLGTLLYPTQTFESTDGPAFINEESSHSLVFGSSSYVENGFYPVLVRESRDGATKETPVTALEGRHMPLFVGYVTPPPGAGQGSGSPGASSGGPGPAAAEGGAVDPTVADGGGCGCSVVAPRASLGGGLLAVVALVVAGAKRRRRP